MVSVVMGTAELVLEGGLQRCKDMGCSRENDAFRVPEDEGDEGKGELCW